MKELKEAVQTLTIGAVMITGIICCDWAALLVEGLIALVYIICKAI